MKHLISGIGCITALGSTRAQTVAAYGTGERGFRRCPDIVGADGLGQTMAPALPIRDPAAPADRLAALLAAALYDLAADFGAAAQGLPVLAVLPTWARDALPDGTVEAALTAVLPGWIGQRQIVWADEMGWLRLLADQCGLINGGARQEVVVAVADTLCLPDLLDHLAAANRLLLKGQPNGLIPGEAAVALRVAPLDAEPAMSGWGHLSGAVDGQEQTPVDKRNTLLGDTLARLWAQPLDRIRPTRLMTDRNGERWRSEDTGTALSRNAPRLPGDLRARTEEPLALLGDPGLARGAVMAVLALSAAPDGPAPEGAAHWTMLSEALYTGARTVAVIARPNPEPAP